MNHLPGPGSWPRATVSSVSHRSVVTSPSPSHTAAISSLSTAQLNTLPGSTCLLTTCSRPGPARVPDTATPARPHMMTRSPAAASRQ